MYPKICDPPLTHHNIRWKKSQPEEVFLCRNCQTPVYTRSLFSGVQNRNHCPYCLWSRHVDLFRPGDRLAACKAIMQPIGLTMKPDRDKFQKGKYGELMLIHRCSDCGKLSINRIASDDIEERLMEIFFSSAMLDGGTLRLLEMNQIRLLQAADTRTVISQLQGNRQN